MDKFVTGFFFAAVFIIAMIYAFFPSSSDKIWFDDNVFDFSDNWNLCIDGEESAEKIDLPVRIPVSQNSVVEISKKLPEQLDFGMDMLFRSSQQFLTVSINGRPVYSYGNVGKIALGKSPGSAWHFVNLHESDAGKEISIAMHSPYKDYAGGLSEIKYGSESMLLLNLIKSKFIPVLSSLFILLTGVALLVAYVFSRKLKDVRSALYLALFAILSAVWSLLETQLGQVFFNNMFALLVLAFGCMLLLPVAFFLFVREAYGMVNKRLINFICILHLFTFFALTALQASNIADYIETHLFITAVFLTTPIVFTSHIAYIYYKRRDAQIRLLFLSFLILLIGEAIDLWRYYGSQRTDVALFFRMSLLAFTIMLAVPAFIELLNAYKQNLKMLILENLAYSDMLTNTKNRTRFEEDLNLIRDREESCLGVGMLVFDINNLKNTNDKLGHAAGDELIKTCVECIRANLSENESLYRIGGDEFVVITSGLSLCEVKDLDERIKLTAKSIETGWGGGISMASGYSVYDDSLDSGVESIFQRADASMYKNKALLKRRKNDR